MVNVVPLVQSIENDYGSVNSAPIFDKRLIKARMLINGGEDPIEKKKYYFDLKLAQKLLDEGVLSKAEIIQRLNIGKRKFQGAIDLGLLNADKWHRKHYLNKGPRYAFYQDGRYLMSGTIKQLALELHVTTSALRYYKTDKYKKAPHRNRCRLVEIN